jgi:hypothetical protein
MSAVIEVQDNSDMPCTQWADDGYPQCPMKEVWYENQVICCPKCGNMIGYNTDDKGY